MTASPRTRASSAAYRSAVTLGLAVTIAGVVLAGVYALTSPTISASRDALLRTEVAALLPPAGSYDNDPLRDRIVFANTQLPASRAGHDTSPRIRLMQLYRARLDRQAAGAVLSLSTDRGYSGDITLLIGIAADGTLRGVRVTSQRETPGLGDAIDASRSDWIRQFDAIDITSLLPEDWRLTRDGGRFDGLTGASVSARAVIDAVGDAVTWYQARQSALFVLPAGAVVAPQTPEMIE